MKMKKKVFCYEYRLVETKVKGQIVNDMEFLDGCFVLQSKWKLDNMTLRGYARFRKGDQIIWTSKNSFLIYDHRPLIDDSSNKIRFGGQAVPSLIVVTTDEQRIRQKLHSAPFFNWRNELLCHEKNTESLRQENERLRNKVKNYEEMAQKLNDIVKNSEAKK